MTFWSKIYLLIHFQKDTFSTQSLLPGMGMQKNTCRSLGTHLASLAFNSSFA